MYYDRINVVIHGIESTARPIEFITDKEKNPVQAVKWEATCPKTGQTLVLTIQDMIFKNDKFYYGESVVQKDSIIVRSPANRIKVSKDRLRSAPIPLICPFVDPIELGLFTK